MAAHGEPITEEIFAFSMLIGYLDTLSPLISFQTWEWILSQGLQEIFVVCFAKSFKGFNVYCLFSGRKCIA